MTEHRKQGGRVENAELEFDDQIAGLEFGGPNSRAGKCRTGKCRTKHFLFFSVKLYVLYMDLIIVSTSLYISIASKVLLLRTCRLAHLCVCVCVSLSVCLSVRKVYCGKMAERIRMPFQVVSGVGRGMGVLDGSGDRRRERGSFGG